MATCESCKKFYKPTQFILPGNRFASTSKRQRFCSPKCQEKARRLYLKTKQSRGICRFCRKKCCPASRIYCERHLAKANEWERGNNRTLASSGRCVQCNKMRGGTGTKWRCRECADRHNAAQREKYQREKTNLLCHCGKPTGGKSECKEHRAKRNTYRTNLMAARRAERVCITCGSRDVEKYKSCRSCRARHIGYCKAT